MAGDASQQLMPPPFVEGEPLRALPVEGATLAPIIEAEEAEKAFISHQTSYRKNLTRRII